MVGRFIGISTLKKYNPGKVLLVHAILSALLVLVSINLEGMFAVYALVAVGFWNSIMFPTIFTLAIRELPHATEKASGLLSTSILGGAFIPLFTGKIADVASLRMGFSLSFVCYLYIAYFGWKYRE